MKNFLKFTLSFTCHLLLIPCLLLLTLCCTYYALPAFTYTKIGNILINYISQEHILLTTIIIVVLSFFLQLMGKIFSVIRSSKVKNFYTHLVTWLIALSLVVEAGYVFIASSNLQTSIIELDIVRKLGILVCIVALLLYMMIAPKVRKLVDRRIQAYDTAKELNHEGRSSVVGMQILKCLDLVCPELLLLSALCFAFSWSISLYFVFVMLAFILPLVGNMICDKRVKIEYKTRKEEDAEAQVHATAEAVIDLIKKETGDNS